MIRDAFIVFRKELIDALRDRRTLLMVLLSSVAIGPVVLVLISALVSNIGNWMQIFTEQWLTLSLAGGEAARWGGRLAFSSGLATLVFIPLGGWIADHLDRPKAMALAQL